MGLGRNYDSMETIGLVNGTAALSGIPSTEPVVQFATGFFHSVFVTEKRIFSIGGKANTGREYLSSCDVLAPVSDPHQTFINPLNSSTYLIDTAAGQTQTFFLNQEGKVFRFKTHGEDVSFKSFVSFTSFQNEPNVSFVSISMRNEHAILLSKEQKVYAIGHSNQFRSFPKILTIFFLISQKKNKVWRTGNWKRYAKTRNFR